DPRHRRVRGPVEDPLDVTGLAGAAPDAIATEVVRQYRVKRLGTAEGVRERIYAVSVDRRLRHPAVQAIRDAARAWVFA
ncbi:MAG TPA: hypothetical protein VF804_09275, partial [Holophagaceae bacterium]